MYIVSWNIPGMKAYETYDYSDAIAEGTRVASTMHCTFAIKKVD